MEGDCDGKVVCYVTLSLVLFIVDKLKHVSGHLLYFIFQDWNVFLTSPYGFLHHQDNYHILCQEGMKLHSYILIMQIPSSFFSFRRFPVWLDFKHYTYKYILLLYHTVSLFDTHPLEATLQFFFGPHISAYM